jgi:glycosyltransferase involved in cell wall biosynthesis
MLSGAVGHRVSGAAAPNSRPHVIGKSSMTVPRVSIITPTFNRSHYLPLLTKCVLNQTVSDFEWLILDDSPQPSRFMQGLSDPRIFYEHTDKKTTIGSKRNRLIEKSRADIIAHFDDDDFYGEEYLAKMISAMNESRMDMVKLVGFFLYSKLYKTLGYWDLMTKLGPHWMWSAEPPSIVTLTDAHGPDFKDNHLGYGFSYLFRKTVWESGPFAEIDFNEDVTFTLKALPRFRLMGLHDDQCTCIHILHGGNISCCLPQYVIPDFLLQKLFPSATDFLAVED